MKAGRALGALTMLACGARSELDVPATIDAGVPSDVVTSEGSTPCTQLVLVEGYDGDLAPEFLSIDADYVYFVADDMSGAPSGLSVVRFPKVGGATQSYAGDDIDSWTITTDDSYVYWGSQAPAGLARAPKTGGAVETLTSLSLPPTELAVDDSYVYYLDSTDAIWRVPKAGGLATTVVTVDTSLSGLALDGDVLFATAENGVLRVDTSGANLAWISNVGDAVTGGDGANRIAVDSTSVYWTSHGGSVRSVAQDGTSLVTYATGGLPWGIAVDDAFVYWADAHLGIFKSPKGVASVTQVTSYDSGDQPSPSR